MIQSESESFLILSDLNEYVFDLYVVSSKMLQN